VKPWGGSDIARQTFDAISEAQQAKTLVELDQILGPRIKDLGFDFYVGINVLSSGGRPDQGVLFGQSFPEWQVHYMERGYQATDTVLREIVSGVEPLFWTDIARRRPLQANELQISNEAADFGLKNEFVTPIHGLDGSLSGVLLVGGDIDTSAPDIRSAAHMLTLYYGAIGSRLHAAELARAAPPVVLSERQMQCLRWVRHGKSSTDIGDLLGLSSRTVDHYIAEACRKLGVRTRTQAAVEAALAFGLQF
jgi:LuxR family transcriptional regulator, quorum-sensing system regulator BjaR1